MKLFWTTIELALELKSSPRTLKRLIDDMGIQPAPMRQKRVWTQKQVDAIRAQFVGDFGKHALKKQ